MRVKAEIDEAYWSGQVVDSNEDVLGDTLGWTQRYGSPRRALRSRSPSRQRRSNERRMIALASTGSLARLALRSSPRSSTRPMETNMSPTSQNTEIWKPSKEASVKKTSGKLSVKYSPAFSTFDDHAFDKLQKSLELARRAVSKMEAFLAPLGGEVRSGNSMAANELGFDASSTFQYAFRLSLNLNEWRPDLQHIVQFFRRIKQGLSEDMTTHTQALWGRGSTMPLRPLAGRPRVRLAGILFQL